MDRVPIDDEEEEEIMPGKTGTLKRALDKTYWAWITIIVFGLVVQCLRSATMSEKRRHFIGTCHVRTEIVSQLSNW